MASDILPPGVVVVDASTALTPAYYFVLKLAMIPKGDALTAVVAAAKKQHDVWIKDFSCGKAIKIIRGFQISYEPYDLTSRLETYCATQLNALKVPYPH